jgi:SPX domain protein involved in polyphosphate accumulation
MVEPNREFWLFFKEKKLKIWRLRGRGCWKEKKNHRFLAILEKKIQKLVKFNQKKKKLKFVRHLLEPAPPPAHHEG